MKKTVVGFLAVVAMAGAQSFQPPSWGQGQGQGQGQGHGAIQDQINQLQSQIQKLREQQQEMSHPPIEAQVGPVTAHPISGKETRRTTQTLADGTELTRDDTSSFIVIRRGVYARKARTASRYSTMWAGLSMI